jgi:G3E family GTPase
VIIETTGLADPAPVAQTFFIDDDIQARYRGYSLTRTFLRRTLHWARA